MLHTDLERFAIFGRTHYSNVTAGNIPETPRDRFTLQNTLQLTEYVDKQFIWLTHHLASVSNAKTVNQ